MLCGWPAVCGTNKATATVNIHDKLFYVLRFTRIDSIVMVTSGQEIITAMG